MGTKLLKKIKHQKRRSDLLEQKRNARALEIESELNLAKFKYRKIWLTNYLLFLALFVLVAVLEHVFRVKSNFVFSLLGILVYGILLAFNHQNRICKNEKAEVSDYEYAATFMGIASKVGILYAGIATTCMAIIP